MNVFLMHRSRDLLPARDAATDALMAAQEEEIRALLGMTKDRPFKARGSLPAARSTLVQDLELNTLFKAMAQGDEFLLEVSRWVILSSLTDLDSIRYRQEILRDCLKNPAIVRDIYRIPMQSIENQQKHWMGIFSSHPGGVLSGAVAFLEMFVGLLQRLRRIADEHVEEFESEGFRRFFAMIQRELDDDYFAAVKKHLKALQFRGGVLMSGALGDANEGANYILHRTNHGGRNWVKRVFARKSPIYSYTLHPRDDAGAQALANLRDRGLNLVANAAAQSADHINNFLKMLRLELAFYIGCLNLQEQLVQLGEPITIPEPAPAAERRHSFTGLYDVCLALTMKQQVVANDLNADRKDLVVITGANQGGKSTFLRSIGLAQLMMQCGMFVPAERFSADVSRGLFTHFKREEDTSMKSGKFDEELGRMSAIVDRLSPDSMVLLNESFAATNEREGSEIARQIVEALLEKRVKVFYVTHLYEFASSLHSKASDNMMFLRAGRQSDGSRSFKLLEGEPLQTSYGGDLYNEIFG